MKKRPLVQNSVVTVSLHLKPHFHSCGLVNRGAIGARYEMKAGDRSFDFLIRGGALRRRASLLPELWIPVAQKYRTKQVMAQVKKGVCSKTHEPGRRKMPLQHDAQIWRPAIKAGRSFGDPSKHARCLPTCRIVCLVLWSCYAMLFIRFQKHG